MEIEVKGNKIELSKSFLTNGERVLPTIFANSCIVKIEMETAFYDFLRI